MGTRRGEACARLDSASEDDEHAVDGQLARGVH